MLHYITPSDVHKVHSRIIESLRSCGLKSLAVMINGSYMMHAGKMVYVKLVDVSDELNPQSPKYDLCFFQVSSDRSASQGDVTYQNGLSDLITELISNTLYGVKLTGLGTVDGSQCRVMTELGLISFESELYSAARQMATMASIQSAIFRFSGNVVPEEQIAALLNAFKRNSFSVFQSLIFAKGNNKFVNKLYKANGFYKLQRAFVPVFVTFSEVYNPLEDPSLQLQQFKIYKMAVEKNRRVELSCGLSAYFLTHREICEAFNMNKFMRFTPLFFYRILVGLLDPSLEEFPNKNSYSAIKPVALRSAETTASKSLKLKYTQSEYLQLLGEMRYKVVNAKSEEEAAGYSEIVTNLEQYETVSSLYYECAVNHARLTNFGSYTLDDPRETTVDKLLAYISDAQLIVA